MRIAVLSDIHGNLHALEAVLADVKAQAPDVTVNLGDILSGPLRPAETADLLMTLDLPTVAGNHERQLLTLPAERMNKSDAFTWARLSERHRAWLRGLPAERVLDGDVLLCHGAPGGDDLCYLLEDLGPDHFRPARPAQVAERLAGVDQDLVLCGHTHLPRMVRLPTGPLVVNPGSVGLPAYDDDRPWPHVVETGSPHARYAVLDRGPAGWSVTFRAVAYDWDRAAAEARAAGRDEWAEALATGTLIAAPVPAPQPA